MDLNKLMEGLEGGPPDPPKDEAPVAGNDTGLQDGVKGNGAINTTPQAVVVKVLPADLLDLPAWLVWKYVRYADEGKPRKVPYYTSGVVRHGVQGSPGDREHLTTFAAAQACFDQGGFDGVGLALLPDWNLVALDFDGCISDGVLDPTVAELVAGTYAERSPSGKGVRALMRGALPDKKSRADETWPFGFETFYAKGFVTVTGDELNPGEFELTGPYVADLTNTVREHFAERFGEIGATRVESVDSDKPKPIGIEKAREILTHLDPSCLEPEWFDILAALHWETQGSAEGLDLADEWSRGGSNYDGRREIETRWRRFKLDHPKPKTLASYRSGEPASDDDFDDLTEVPEQPKGVAPKAVKAVHEDFYANLADHDYIHRPTRGRWPAASVNNHLRPVGDFSASQWLDRQRFVTQMTWDPGQGEIIHDKIVSDGGWIEKPGQRVYNTYRAPTIALGDPEKAAPWLEHCERLCGADWPHMLAYFAHTVQRPGEKINHAIVLGGAPGIGKDSLLEAIKRAVGPWNCAEVSPQQMLGRFNGHLKSVMVRVSEARNLGDEDRFAFYDATKTIIAAPPDTLTVDEKNVREYSILNVVRVILTTNHRINGIYLPPDDRRHYVTWSEINSAADWPEGHFARFWEWLNTGGDTHVAAYLRTFDLSGFDPKAPPPKTEAWHAIVSAGSDPVDSDLRTLLERMGEPAVVTMGDLFRESDVPAGETVDVGWMQERKNRRAIPHQMERAGYLVVRNPNSTDGLWRIDGKRQALYGRKSLNTADRMQAAYERNRQ